MEVGSTQANGHLGLGSPIAKNEILTEHIQKHIPHII